MTVDHRDTRSATILHDQYAGDFAYERTMVIDFAAAAREAAARVTSTPSALLQQEVSRIKMIFADKKNK